jgi:hypothetical protein
VPRALAVFRRQLALRARLKAAGAIGHDHVFFRETGEPFWNLQIPGKRWRTTLDSLKLRYRRPYTARHSSVSWNLMVGKTPLWVAKQHGHSISTMLRVYAAWAEGAVESDIEAIKRSMNRHARLKPTASCRSSAGSRPRGPRPTHPRPKRTTLIGKSPEFGNLAVDLPVETGSKPQVPDNWRKILAERVGFDPLGINKLLIHQRNSAPYISLHSPRLAIELAIAHEAFSIRASSAMTL